jgi:hypothetical protein
LRRSPIGGRTPTADIFRRPRWTQSPNPFYLVTLLHSRGLANPLVIDPFDTMPKDPSATSCCTCTIYMLYVHSTLHLPQCTHDQAVSSYYVLPSSTISSDPWCWQSETTVLDFWVVASFGTLVRTLFVRFSINVGARVAKAAKRSSTLCGSVRSPALLPGAPHRLAWCGALRTRGSRRRGCYRITH